MKMAEIYSNPDFPHGTKEGHEQGCKGSQCPARVDGGMSCTMAHIKYQGDYAYRKCIDAGEVWVEPVALSVTKQRLLNADTRFVRVAPDVEPTPAYVVDHLNAPLTLQGLPRKKQGRSPGPIPHGTRYGTVRGCTDEVGCPSVLEGGISCAQARRDHVNKVRRSLVQERDDLLVEVERLRAEIVSLNAALLERGVA